MICIALSLIAIVIALGSWAYYREATLQYPPEDRLTRQRDELHAALDEFDEEVRKWEDLT